jgi:acyl carrier protein phosphodiesterase
LPQRTINWNHTPWQEDWFEDNEDMQALRTSIVTINHELTVGVLRHVVVDLLYVIEVLLTILL